MDQNVGSFKELGYPCGGTWSAGTCTDWTDWTDPEPETTPEEEPEVEWPRVPVAALVPALAAAAAAWLRVPDATPVAAAALPRGRRGGPPAVLLSLVDMFNWM